MFSGSRSGSSRTFIPRRDDCERIWSTFEQVYVGRDPCKVPPDAYNPLFELVPITTPRSKVTPTRRLSVFLVWHLSVHLMARCNLYFGGAFRPCSGAKPKMWSTTTSTGIRIALSPWRTLCWGWCWTGWCGAERRAATVRLRTALLPKQKLFRAPPNTCSTAAGCSGAFTGHVQA